MAADDLRVKLTLEAVDHISSPMEKVSAKVAGSTKGITEALKKAARAAAEFGAGLKEGVARGLSEMTAKTKAATDATDKLARSTARAGKASRQHGAVAAGIASRLEGLSGRAGGTGTALAAMGTAGLVAGAGLGAVAVAGGAAFLGVRKILTVTDGAINQFAALNDQSIALGMSMEQFQEFDFGAAGVGVKTDQSVMALTRLNDALGSVVRNGKDIPKELATTFQALGIRGRDIAASGGDINAILPKIADGIKNIKSHSERVSLLNNLFGARAGAKFLQLFEKGAEGLKEIKRQAYAAGGILSTALVDKLIAADNRLDALSKASRAATGAIGASFAGASATLSEFRVRTEQAFAAWVVKNGIGEKVEAALQRAGAAFDAWIQRMGGAEAVMNTLAGAAGTAFGFIGDAVAGGIRSFQEIADWIQRVKAFLEAPVSMTGLLGVFGLKFEMPAWLQMLIDGASKARSLLSGVMGGGPSVSIPMPAAPSGTSLPGEAAQLGTAGRGVGKTIPWVNRNIPSATALPGATKSPSPGAPAVSIPIPAPIAGPGATKSPSPGEAAQLGTAGRGVGKTIPWVNRNIPSASALPKGEKHSSNDWSGVVDLNVRGPASVGRTRTRGPVELRTNQGMNLGVG